ncbi:HNH endonuclease signature motif containing protein [Microbacterium sp. NPDC056234]|uniref:HNH endonuclease signature motif containing protein n=1 Tax=Microbacterium sp. NPDC056234 TaxID=3345757 RepID=UPI0035D59217
MSYFTDIDGQVSTLRALLGEDAEATDLVARLSALSDDELVEAMGASAAVSRCLEKVTVLGAGIAAARSTRSSGHGGLAQSRGHRSPVSLLQEVTGGTRSDATQHIRVGTSLLRAENTGNTDSDSAEQSSDARPNVPWHAPVDEALLTGLISAVQHDVILRGLGEPLCSETATISTSDAERRDAWLLAAEQLVDEAAHRTVEELGSAARTLRDVLDPEGAERRYLERHNARSFRTWTDRDGIHHSSAVHDDEGFALVKTIEDAAMRPRRGGPRFVDDSEKDDAQTLIEDPRSNEQLAYDLLIDLLHAGARAEAPTVFGVKQAGVRIVQTVHSGAGGGTALTEDGLIALPRVVAEQHICDTGTVDIHVDVRGNPLAVGREHRLFTPTQRVALAVRDGGCRWRNCDRPSSYCEAHHIDTWSGGGRTDIERGILLCRFHHMQLHHGGWSITRDGAEDFVLNHSSGTAFALPRRLSLRYVFADGDPPPRRFRPVA